jgi:hypothetical protein
VAESLSVFLIDMSQALNEYFSHKLKIVGTGRKIIHPRSLQR